MARPVLTPSSATRCPLPSPNVPADGQVSLRFNSGEAFDSRPVFDPDGRTIYFRSNRGGTWNIWKCRLSDAAMAKLGVGR